MKIILIISGALMLSASIYGFIDYRKAASNGMLEQLYKDKIVAAKKNFSDNGSREKQAKKIFAGIKNFISDQTETIATLGMNKRIITLDEFSRAPLRIADDEELPVVNAVIETPPASENITVAATENIPPPPPPVVHEKKKNKKNLSLERFSRAAMEDVPEEETQVVIMDSSIVQ